MIIEKDGIYAFKLSSGQEVVGKAINISELEYTLEKPLTIGQGKDGQMQFLPIMFTGEHLADAVLQKTAVALTAPLREDIETAYLQSIDPDAVEIITPPEKRIITG